jgi:hypothetical protein
VIPTFGSHLSRSYYPVSLIDILHARGWHSVCTTPCIYDVRRASTEAVNLVEDRLGELRHAPTISEINPPGSDHFLRSIHGKSIIRTLDPPERISDARVARATLRHFPFPFEGNWRSDSRLRRGFPRSALSFPWETEGVSFKTY